MNCQNGIFPFLPCELTFIEIWEKSTEFLIDYFLWFLQIIIAFLFSITAYVPTPSSSHSSANTAIICAAVAGALLVILIIAYMLARWQRRRKLDAEEREEAEMSHNHAPADLPPPFIVYEGGAAGAVIFPAPPPYKEKEALGDDYSSGVQPPMYEDVDPADTEKARMAARESSAENPYDGVANNGPVTGNSFDNASYDNVEFSSGSRN